MQVVLHLSMTCYFKIKTQPQGFFFCFFLFSSIYLFIFCFCFFMEYDNLTIFMIYH